MKLVRSVAYAVIVICALLCIVIAIYASKKTSGEEGEPGEIHVISHGSETEEPSESPESGATVPNIADLIIDRAQSAGSSSSKVSISGNNTGEISYDEIVKRQNEDLDREFRTIISDYNKKYGIEVKTPTSTTATVSKDYKYFVNKNTKFIHRIDCLLKPVNGSDMIYYETIREAEKAGYTERCPVCSP